VDDVIAIHVILQEGQYDISLKGRRMADRGICALEQHDTTDARLKGNSITFPVTS